MHVRRPLLVVIAGAMSLASGAALANGPDSQRSQAREPNWEEAEDLSGFALMPRLGFGVSGTGFATVVQFGLGLDVYLAKGLALGFHFDDTLILYTFRTVEDNPGLRDALPRHVLSFMPHAKWVMMPKAPFSPYLRAGLGAVVHDRSPLGPGAPLGKWTTGLGIIFTVDGFWLDLGLGIGAQFPDPRFQRVWSFGDVDPFCGAAGEPCSLRLEPRFGLGYAFGRKHKR